MKRIAKSVRELGRKFGNLDGKRKGVSQKEGEFIFREMVNVRAAEKFLNRRKSIMDLIEEKADKKLKAYKRKLENSAKLKGKK